jgi:CubicO group peptidase (beta-lactamase class C family)
VDIRVSAGIIVGFVLIVGAVAFLVFNPTLNNSISGDVLSTVNQTGNNTNNTNNIAPLNVLITLNPAYAGYSQSYSLPSPSSNPETPADPMDHVISLFSAYVNSIFPKTGIPGTAIVIVKDDKILYMGCLGVKDLASGAPVDPNTLFEIGSCSKAFTATNIAQYVSEGLMSWDDPISKYFTSAEFQMYDSSATDKLSIRDCLSHRSGQPAYSQDMEWMIFNDSYSRMLYNLRDVKNNTAYNTTYNYNNIVYALAGYYAARDQHATWSDLIKEDLLDPLGMTTATTTVKDFFNSPDHATPYKLLSNGTLIPYHTVNLDDVGPAGSLGLSIAQMANWLKFQIADTGIYNGVQIVSKKELDETRTGQITFGEGAQYAMGWIVNDQLITHAGDTLSSQTYVTIFKTKGIGLVSLTNAGPIGLNFNTALVTKLGLLLKGDEVTDPFINPKPAPYPDPVPPLVAPLGLGNYTGIYTNDFYGNITITTENNILKCFYGHNTQPNDLNHWNGDVFIDPIYDMPFNFTDIHDNSAHQLEITGPQNYNTTPAGQSSIFNRTGP